MNKIMRMAATITILALIGACVSLVFDYPPLIKVFAVIFFSGAGVTVISAVWL